MTERTLVSPPSAASLFRRLGFLLPVLVFAMVAVGLGIGLTRNPQEIPSALIGKAVPEFSLPPVQGRTLGLASGDLQAEVSLVNVFASWCTACRYEHPLFMQLEEDGVVPIHGLNYKTGPRTPRNGSMTSAIPTPGREPTSTGVSASSGASTACPRPS
jgi:cytochrome c biogenesis protein CcmG, thiol:disulfide interchange protein DsbE